MEPIATYEERKPGKYRHYTLHSDRLHAVETHRRKIKHFDFTFQLKGLSPTINRVWRPDEERELGVLLAFCLAFIASLFCARWLRDTDNGWLLLLAVTICFSIPVLLLYRGRRIRIEHVVLCSRDNVAVIEISESGNTRANFESFIQQIEKAVASQQARGEDGEPAAAPTTPPKDHPSRRLPQ
jgi:hypothetical protein